MPDENRFARLGDAIGESSGEESEPEDGEESSEREPSEPTPEATPESDDGGDGETASEGETEEEETGDGPAFEFEDTTAKSMYVRPETVDVLDDAEFEVESFLRREHDVRDLTGREFHDALVRVAAEYPDEVAGAIIAARDGEE